MLVELHHLIAALPEHWSGSLKMTRASWEDALVISYVSGWALTSNTRRSLKERGALLLKENEKSTNFVAHVEDTFVVVTQPHPFEGWIVTVGPHTPEDE